MSQDPYQEFVRSLSLELPKEQIITNPLQLLAYGNDASFYRLVPKVVVFVKNDTQVRSCLLLADNLNLGVCFRAAGTSLSGQGVTDSILVVATKDWQNYQILKDGLQIKLQPGITGAKANQVLKALGRKIGPDPASLNAAMIGGIAANNASGMCCGTNFNTYNTLAEIRIVLQDGTILDTSDPQSKESFIEKKHDLINQIITLRNQIQSDQVLKQTIIDNFKIKNTIGYSLNAFIDYSDPIDIISHLIIGSEGTLAFISDITYHTVINYAFKSCALVFFKDIEQAALAVNTLKDTPVSAVELMDRNSITSIENEPLAPAYFKDLPQQTCVLLIETQANSQQELHQNEQVIQQGMKNTQTLEPITFTSNPALYAFYWKARKGLLPSVGALRKAGSTCIIEDVAFKVEDLAQGALALQKLFKDHKYHDAVLFGHALQGNLHLVFSQDFSSELQVKRYQNLMQGLVDIVIDRFKGTLKAEHGTGRNMAPFVEKQWGEKAYEIILAIKKIFDPKNLLNPGVIVNANPKVHLENLKPCQQTNPIIDSCIECGFCESNCVSHNLSLSPRQRIVVAREVQRLKNTNSDPLVLQNLLKYKDYFVDQTCATDGLCALSCPVSIDTGEYVKSQRAKGVALKQSHKTKSTPINLAQLTKIGRLALSTLKVIQNTIGDNNLSVLSRAARGLSRNTLPQWNPAMPGACKTKLNNSKPSALNKDKPKVVYFASCINRTMGKSNDYPSKDKDLVQTTLNILEKAGFQVIYPKNINSLCCSMPFASKGYTQQAKEFEKDLQDALNITSNFGEIPIIFDMSPCYHHFHGVNLDQSLKLYDPITFMLEKVMPILPVKQSKEQIDIFAVCSVKKDNLQDKLLELANLCSSKVNVLQANCCGFAGDKGFFYPELNAFGTKDIKKQISSNTQGCYSTSRTCEIGLSNHTKENFKSIFYLIDQVTQ